MKSLLDIIPSLFQDYSGNLSEVTTNLNNLSSVSAKSSTFLNAMIAAKTVNAELNSSKLSTNLFDCLSNISDMGFDKDNTHLTPRQDSTSVEIVKNMINMFGSKAGWNPTNSNIPVIGYYQGIPIYAKCQDDGIGSKSLDLMTDPTNQNRSTFLSTSITDDDYGKIAIFKTNMADEGYPYSVRIGAYDEHNVWQSDYYEVSIDNIVSDSFNSYISYDCLSNIIRRAQSDGVVSRDQIESVLNQYAKTDITEAIQSMIAGSGKFDYISVLAIIGKVLSLNDAEYTSGNQFKVYDRPNYVTSIIQAVVSIVVATVAVILSAIFHAIGVIISVVMSIVSRIVDMISAKLPSTESKIVTTTLTPVFNFPVATFEITRAEWQVMAINGRVTFDFEQLLNYISEQGCAMLFPANGPDLSPYYLWILGKDDTTVTVQVLLNTTIPSVTTATIIDSLSMYTNSPIPTSGTPLCNISMSNINHGAYSNYVYPLDTSYTYLSYNDEKIRRAASINLMLFLQDWFCKNLTATSFGLNDFNVGGWESNSDPTQVDWSKVTIGSIRTRLGYMSYDVEHKLLSYAVLGALPTSSMINNYDAITPSWDALTDIMNTCNDGSNVIKAKLITTVLPNTNIKFNAANLYPGYSLADPAIIWPNLSRSALIGALVVSAVAAAAITGISIGAKVGLKRAAFNRLAVRQIEFNAAQREYEQMYKDVNTYGPTVQQYSKDDIRRISNAYYKANRRLTRAWSLAGKLGLSMFNGFSTGSSNAGASVEGISPLTSVTQGISSPALNTVSGCETNAYTSYDIYSIYHIITGQ